MFCKRCSTEKPDSEKQKGYAYCKDCFRERIRGSESKKRNERKAKYKRLYGITIERYDEMAEEQNNKCAICETDRPGPKRIKRFNVDHCHTTKKVRGLLCSTCNLLLGNLKDNPDLMPKIVKYLKG